MSKRPHNCGGSADRLAPELSHRNTSRPRRRQARVHGRRRRDAFGHRVPAGAARHPRVDVPTAMTRGTSPGCALELEVNAIRVTVARWEAGAYYVSSPRPDEQLGAIVELTLGTSARIGEVLAIRRRDIDLTGVRPTIPARLHDRQPQVRGDVSAGSPQDPPSRCGPAVPGAACCTTARSLPTSVRMIITLLMGRMDEILQLRREQLRAGRDHLEELLTRMMPEWDVPHVDGGIVTWIGLGAPSQLAARARRSARGAHHRRGPAVRHRRRVRAIPVGADLLLPRDDRCRAASLARAWRSLAHAPIAEPEPELLASVV